MSVYYKNDQVWSYCMKVFCETSCLLSKSCSASVHFCPLLQRGFIFSFFSPAGERLCVCSFFSKMLEWTCHSSESLIVGRQLFFLWKKQRPSVSNYTAVTPVQKSPGSRWLKRTVLGEEKGCHNFSLFAINKQCQVGSLSCSPQLISHPVVLMVKFNLLFFHK